MGREWVHYKMCELCNFCVHICKISNLIKAIFILATSEFCSDYQPIILSKKEIKFSTITMFKHQHIDFPLKPVTEAITNGFFTVDRNWTVKQWNKAAESLLDINAKDIIGRNLWEKFAKIVPETFYKVYHKSSLQDIPLHFEQYWSEMAAWFDVNTYHYNNTLSVSFKSTKEPARAVHPEEQLKILNQLYRCVTEITNDCLWEWDLAAKEIFWIDGGHKRVFGYPIVNAIIPEFFWKNRIHPDDRARMLDKLKKINSSEAGATWEGEYRFEKADGGYADVHDMAHIIYDKDGKPSRMIGATQDITARKSAEAKLLETERKLAQERLVRQKTITDAILSAQEGERAHIGKELHDNLNQVLGAAKLYIEMAKTDEMNREFYLEKSSGYVLNVIDSIRKLSKTLIIPGVRDMGILDSIRILLDDQVAIHPIKIEFIQDGIDEESLPEKLQVDIFRILQEQLNNIFKHAEATYAKISLTMQDSQIILLIADNGKGNDLLQVSNGIGILNIKSRAESYNGNVTIISSPGQGYELKVVIPLIKKV